MSDMTPALLLKDVVVSYGTSEVLHNCSLTIQRGQWAGLMGPNGSGKTTLLSAAVGRQTLQSGAITVGGVDLAVSPRQAKANLGYAVDPNLIPGDLTGQQCLDIFALGRQLDAVDAGTLSLCEELRLAGWLRQPVGKYSLGTRQKLAVALAVLGEPGLLVLDEVFNGLDPISAQALKRWLQDRVTAGTCGVLMATHSLSLIESCCTSAHLLVEGNMVSEWSAAELQAIKSAPGGLEHAIVARMTDP